MSDQQELTVRPSTPMVQAAQGKLLDYLGKYRTQIVQILPKHLTTERVLKLIVGEINRTPALLQCSPASVINSVLHAASLGLEIRPRSSYLIPFGRECQLLIDYRGKIDLALRSGKIEDIEARIVYAADELEIEFGLEPKLIHKPVMESAHRGKPVLVYAIAWYSNGRKPHVEPMTIAEIEHIRSKSRSKDSPAWKNDWEQMARKTVIHRICNYISQSPEIAQSQEIDDSMDAGNPLPNIIEHDPEHDQPMVEVSVEAAQQVYATKLQELREGGASEEEIRSAAQRFEGMTAQRQAKEAKSVKAARKVVRNFEDFPDCLEISDEQIYVHGQLYGRNDDNTGWRKVAS